MKKIILLLLIACMLVSAVGCTQEVAEENEAEDVTENPVEKKSFKVAMILPGQINDMGWNESAYTGLELAEKDFDIEIAYTENVTAPDAESSITGYAIEGYDLIVAHGFQFTDYAKAVATEFPDTKFIVVNGTEFQAPNMTSYRFKTGQAGFIGGYLAGLLTESNTIGVMVKDKSPNNEFTKNSFIDAAKLANPDVEVFSAYTDSYSDIAKGKEIAISMIEEGADIILCNANQVGLGSIEACKEAGIYALGFISDQHDIAPETVLVSVKQEISKLVYSIVKDGVSGDIPSEIRVVGMKEGVVGISSFHEHADKVTPEIQAKIDEMVMKLSDGTYEEEGIFKAIN